MKIDEGKLGPELRRWIREDTSDERTVTLRLAFSQDLEEARTTLDKIGMVVQSCGPGVVVATADGRSISQASCQPWVVSIDLPQRLDMKAGLLAAPR